MSIQRLRPSKGDINKIKMEVSDDGKYIRYADYLKEVDALNHQIRMITRSEKASSEEIAALKAENERLRKNTEKWRDQRNRINRQSYEEHY